ncbi:DUF4869 domain-containing protein [Pseudobutyrivibrio xylanivorans]|uniref:DUF4869 domain-containing protein n=1 Tax=Pseudobutyrivibrio xylanivorans DSM 14809 TaxID=1123012 RepID=A0A1M6JGZ7_PSEXY|nr:DUF4869 domain-containing protein [Pseudobutyrivibrio xylanivorans]SHJ45882.1 protein of unknown function [Pseudobutyrivibrio xylanivorans DSM 14809]
MLTIIFGDYKDANYISNPDMFFDNTYEDKWLESDLAKDIVKDIDKSDLEGPNLVVSPVLGSIPVTRISGGAKTLIQIAFDSDHIFNASACGDNCAKWLLKIGNDKDIVVRMGHVMHFPEESFDIKIANTGDIVHTPYELVEKVITEGLLD